MLRRLILRLMLISDLRVMVFLVLDLLLHGDVCLLNVIRLKLVRLLLEILDRRCRLIVVVRLLKYLISIRIMLVVILFMRVLNRVLYRLLGDLLILLHRRLSDECLVDCDVSY